jgi:hypothetical protein
MVKILEKELLDVLDLLQPDPADFNTEYHVDLITPYSGSCNGACSGGCTGGCYGDCPNCSGCPGSCYGSSA